MRTKLDLMLMLHQRRIVSRTLAPASSVRFFSQLASDASELSRYDYLSTIEERIKLASTDEEVCARAGRDGPLA